MYWTTASWDWQGSSMLIAQNGGDHSGIEPQTGIADRCTTFGSSVGNSMDRVFYKMNKIWNPQRRAFKSNTWHWMSILNHSYSESRADVDDFWSFGCCRSAKSGDDMDGSINQSLVSSRWISNFPEWIISEFGRAIALNQRTPVSSYKIHPSESNPLLKYNAMTR